MGGKLGINSVLNIFMALHRIHIASINVINFHHTLNASLYSLSLTAQQSKF